MPPPLNSKVDVCDYMDDEMVEFNFRGQPQDFLPQSAFDQVTEKEVIRRLIAQDKSAVMNDRAQADFVDRVYQVGRRLFATCVYCGAFMEYLKIMLENGLTDGKLPLVRKDFGSLREQRDFVQNFIANQGKFNTTFFTEGDIQILDDRMSKYFAIPIDYEESVANFKGKGAFGEVWKVKIHPDHRSFSCSTNADGLFAMKVTQHEGGREENYHRAMAGVTHPHLVKCLTSFTLGKKYQMVYELANFNMEEFMKQADGDRHDPLTASWLTEQLAGLAGALVDVHNPKGSSPPADSSMLLTVPGTGSARTGYIHDIKPDNILVFMSRGSMPCLRLSDFSCARVVDVDATASGKRESYKTHTKKGTPSYRAPESHKGELSRPYDIWSLGCVYLELIVWFVEGYGTLKTFRASRRCEVYPHGVEDEGFYCKDEDGVVELREPVAQKIKDLSKSCEGGLKDIVDVIPSLLKIEPLERFKAAKLADELKHLDTAPDPADVTNYLAKGLSVSTTSIANLQEWESDSDFGGLVNVIHPSDG